VVQAMMDVPPDSGHLISYQEALRSLGALLDAAVSPRVRLVVDVAGITVDAPGGFGQQHFAWGQLGELAAARRSLRGRLPSADSLPFSRWENLLRVAGRALDAVGLPRFELHAALAPTDDPFHCYLEVTVDGQHRLGAADLTQELREVEAIRAGRGNNGPGAPSK
jgi:hypothetical protein